MEYAFSIMMFIFGGAVLLYAGILALTKDYQLVAKSWAVKPKNSKRYAVEFAKTMAIIAIAPIVSGIVGLFGNAIVNTIVAVVSFIACFVIGIKAFDPDGDDTGDDTDVGE